MEIVTTTGLPCIDGKAWVARCTASYDYADYVKHEEEVCLQKMGWHVQVSRWLKDFQAEIQEDLGGDEPKVVEAKALSLKVSFNVFLNLDIVLEFVY